MTRSVTLSPKMLKRDVREGRCGTEDVSDLPSRPRTRADCCEGPRPCPWVSCRFNLYLDVNPRIGSIQFNFPNLEPDQLNESCALDIAERGGATLEFVGEVMNVTRERVRQMEFSLLKQKLKHNPNLSSLEPAPEGLTYPPGGSRA